MGRPLNKKYFANTNYTNEGVGGEGVASVTVVSGDSAGYDAATDTVAFSAPQIAGGQTATGTLVVVGGAVTGVTVTDSGSGYTSAPTLTITTVGGTETTLSLTAVLTSGTAARQNGIVCQAITVGATNRTSGNDILKQVSSKRFKVRTQDGTAVCKLTAGTPAAAGEMAIVATDSIGGTYFVTKITAHRATLTAGTGAQFTTGTQVPWTFGTATVDVSVKIPNA